MKDLIFPHFEKVEDPRSTRNQRHNFITLIGTTFLSALSGIDSFSGIQDFVEAHFEELKPLFDFPNGAASHDTYRRLWDTINPHQFSQAFQDFTACLKTIVGELINIDGKTIRNSGSDKALHIVSAWCQVNQLVLAQEKVNEKSNEITAIPKLLRLLDLKGHIVTIDAMGAQRDICQQITDQEGDYIISLKGNQGTLHDDVTRYLLDPEVAKIVSIHEENDKGHGRLEQRTAYVTEKIEWLQELHEWPGLKSIGMVHTKVWKKGKEVEERRFYISSLAEDARKLNEAARAHWGIENQLHWRLDVVFNEDKGCIRNDNAAENMDILRKWALNILHKAKEKPDQSIKSVMRKNAMSLKYLVACVKKILHARL
jgi:predicted transposase YbfD/YdcC